MTDKDIVDSLYAVIKVPGKNPAWHYKTVAQVKRMWPALGRLLDQVVRSREDKPLSTVARPATIEEQAS